jgi:two-component system, NarL family, response regulator DegU
MNGVIKDAVNILLVDDHELMRIGLRTFLDRYADMKVVAEAQSSAVALEAAAREQPDIILLDLDLGSESGLDLISALRMRSTRSRILVLTGLCDSNVHRQAVRLGAAGLVLKGQPISTLIQAIRQVAAGQAWLDSSLVAEIVFELSEAQSAQKPDPADTKIARLTERELEVIGLICEGLQNKVIAQRLTISESTVRHHLTSVFTKLEVETRLELVIFAFQHQLTKLAATWEATPSGAASGASLTHALAYSGPKVVSDS